MFEWSDTDIIMRDAVREFIAKEIRPHLDGLESGELTPHPIARKLFSEFGLDVMAAEAVKSMLDKQRARQEGGSAGADSEKKSSGLGTSARRRRWRLCWSPRSPESASDCCRPSG